MNSIDMNMKVLVADDAPTMCVIIVETLKKIGFKYVDKARDGEEALELMKNKAYHFLVSDWSMPKMTGIELITAMKNDPKLKELPILLVTAEANPENLKQAIEMGVKHFIVKPFSKETFVKKIEQIFGTKCQQS